MAATAAVEVAGVAGGGSAGAAAACGSAAPPLAFSNALPRPKTAVFSC